MDDLDFIQRELQDSLEEGWRQFREGPLFPLYEQLFRFTLIYKDYYESQMRESIPTPPYHLGAQEIGRRFVRTARRLGVYFDEIFPGDYDKSTEVETEHGEARVFTMNAYKGAEPICLFRLIFYHKHDVFDFPQPPKLEIIRDVEHTHISGL